jgi:hypothetical protein
VPNDHIIFGGTEVSRTVTITPTAYLTGTATISVTVSDGPLNATSAFTLTVTPNLNIPRISAIANQTIRESTATAAIPFTLTDADTLAASLILSASSSDTTLVPNSNIALSGTGANRTVTITPATGQTGTATIALTVSDGTFTSSTTFLLTVTADFKLHLPFVRR